MSAPDPSRDRMPVLIGQVIPFLGMFATMVLVTIVIDYALHALDLVRVGRYLGPIGTVIIIASFGYSLRKRKIIRSGSPKKLLALHEYMAWTGSVMILVHAGIHFNAQLPWIATVFLLISVASGLVGKFLLKRASTTVDDRRSALIASGRDPGQVEKELFLDLVAVSAMKQWRVVHVPIALLVAIFSLMHMVSIWMFIK